MSQLLNTEEIRTLIEILSTPSSISQKTENKLKAFKFLIRSQYFSKEVSDAYEKYHDKSLEEIYSIYSKLKPFDEMDLLDIERDIIIGIRTLEASLYEYKYILPTLKALKYYFYYFDVNNYIKMLKDSNSEEHKVDTLFELFECLCKYNIELQKAILSEIDNGIAHSELIYFLKEKNFIEFCNIIKTNKLDLNNAFYLCSLEESSLLNTMSVEKNIFEKAEKIISDIFLQEKNFYDLDNLEKEIEIENLSSEYSFLFEDDFDITKLTNEEHKRYSEYCILKLKLFSGQLGQLNRLIEAQLAFICYSYEFVNQHIFNLLINKLTKTECKYYNLYADIFLTGIKNIEEDSNKSSYYTQTEHIDFNLPSDLFEPNKYLTYHNKEEFFNLKPDLKIRKYPEILEKLINELADWGYINNDNETKRLFAYRFTGKKLLRPEELNKILWKEQGRSKRGYSLLHLIKKLTYDYGTYGKVKEFFTGVEWGEKLNEDANEKNASIRFKRLLHKVSPEDFTNPDKK